MLYQYDSDSFISTNNCILIVKISLKPKKIINQLDDIIVNIDILVLWYV